MMLESRMIGMLESRLKRVGLPISMTLWNGSIIRPSTEAQLRLTVKSPPALMFLANPSLGGIATAYVEWQLDLDGEIRLTILFVEGMVTEDSHTFNNHSNLCNTELA